MADLTKHLQEMTFSSAVIYAAVAIPVYLLLSSLFSRHSLRHIPTVGASSIPLLSYIGAHKFHRDARIALQEGYDKFKGSIFKVAMFDQWLVIINGPQLVDEVQKLPDEKASFLEGAGELIGTKYMFGHEVHDHPYHVSIIRSQLTRNIASLFGEIHDEIDKCFGDMVQATEKGWTPIATISTFRHMVARVSSRVFVGEPLCHNSRYLNLSTGFTIDITRARAIINRFPVFMKQFVADRLTRIDARIEEGLKYVGPTIEERIKIAKELGQDWNDKPNDMLQWLIDEATARGHDSRRIVAMLLVVNFAAIFTTSNSLSHAVHHLAASPEITAVLREEVERVVAEDGWTKAAMGKMRKLDSFLRESQRYNGINISSVTRQMLQDVTLSNGTYLPKGTLLVTPSHATHFDDANYKDPEVFDPWRFVAMRDDTDNGVNGNLKYQFVTTSVDYIVFGHGKHACPGRFFAVNELKAFVAYMIVNYDLKLGQDGRMPKTTTSFLSVLPDPSAQVLFRKRVA